MKVKILRTIGRKDTLARDNENPTSLALPPKRDGSMYQEGEVVDLPPEDAEKFTQAKVGELVQTAGAK